MRTLFVSRDYSLKRDGGCTVVKRNLLLLKHFFDEVIEMSIPIPSSFTRLKNIIGRESYGNTRLLKSQIRKHLEEKYDFVFFDSSLYGGYLKLFADRGSKVCCFYHNVEYKYYSDKYNVSKKLQDKLMVPYIKYNETLSTNFSTYRITLNERDSSDLMNAYGKKADFILPTSFSSLDLDLLENAMGKETSYVLFVGSNFFANVEGLEFFFKEVAPYINCRVKIVGNVCDVFKRSQLPSNVVLVGMVDDLLPYYVNASCVIAPIFSGSGLKTKTIEALRYGKKIVGTQESFEGIPQRYYSIIGQLCTTASEFINAVNSLDEKGCNREVINLFNELYSDNAQEKRFHSFLRENGFVGKIKI